MTAEPVDDRQVRVSWRRGAEPDLQRYVVSEGGSTVAEVAAGACDGGTCSTTVGYPAAGSGAHTYAVKAFRSDGGSGALDSGSSEASATLAAPPAEPAPAPSGGADGGTGGTTTDGGTGAGTGGATTSAGGTGGGTTGAGGTTTGSGAGGSAGGASGGGTGAAGGAGAGSGAGGSGTAPLAVGTAAPGGSVEQAVAQRKAFALSFSAFGPKLGIPKLPPLPQAQSPDVAPLPDGTYEPTLGFQDQVVTERTEAQTPAQRVTGVVGRALDSEQLVRSTAGALVLLLCGAHLRRWLAAGPQE